MIAAIVLAAGQSRRMGRQKLLLPFGGQPAITRMVDELLRSQVEKVLVVTRADRGALEEALTGRPVHWVTNPAPESEMLESVRCGLRALPPEATAALLLPGDQPGVTAALVDQIISARRQTTRTLVLPVHAGRRGHPLLIDLIHREEVLHEHDEVGVRGLLRKHADEILEVPVDSPWLLEDMDVPEDYARLAAALTHEQEPGR